MEDEADNYDNSQLRLIDQAPLCNLGDNEKRKIWTDLTKCIQLVYGQSYRYRKKILPIPDSSIPPRPKTNAKPKMKSRYKPLSKPIISNDTLNSLN